MPCSIWGVNWSKNRFSISNKVTEINIISLYSKCDCTFSCVGLGSQCVAWLHVLWVFSSMLLMDSVENTLRASRTISHICDILTQLERGTWCLLSTDHYCSSMRTLASLFTALSSLASSALHTCVSPCVHGVFIAGAHLQFRPVACVTALRLQWFNYMSLRSSVYILSFTLTESVLHNDEESLPCLDTEGDCWCPVTGCQSNHVNTVTHSEQEKWVWDCVWCGPEKISRNLEKAVYHLIIS